MSNTNIKILVCYHTPSILFKDSILTPIHGGRALSQKKKASGIFSDDEIKWLYENTIGDDTGDNISSKNKTYNELTCIYWAWKNQNQLQYPDYIGLVHYRRHLILNESLHPKNNRWTVDFPNTGDSVESYLNKIGYSKNSIEQLVKIYPCIIASKDTKFSVYNQYKHAQKSDFHHIEDLDLCIDLIKKLTPEYYKACKNYLSGNKQYFANTFILRKDLFNEYCSFIFTILKEFENKCSKKLRSSYEKRFFVSERLTGIFVEKIKEDGYAIKELCLSYLESCEIPSVIKPISQNCVTCVFAVDNNYLKQLNVSLISLIEHTGNKRVYEIFILHKDISKDNISYFKSSLPHKSNVTIKFINIYSYLTNIHKNKLYIVLPHVSLATYYRALIQEIFPNHDKIIYFDTDLIFLDDIANLYDFNLDNKLIGAAQDIREQYAAKNNAIFEQKNWKSYITNTLKIDDYTKYFQAGVLLFNLKSMRSINLKAEFLKKLSEIKKPILSDQDILNAIFYKNVSFFDYKWNIEWQIEFEFKNLEKSMTEEDYLTYQQALDKPSIIHYASPVKPWKQPITNTANIWWGYARHSVYYEQLLYAMTAPIFSKNVLFNIHSLKDKIKTKFPRIYILLRFIKRKLLF